jgi:hypothetical protein
MVTSSEPRSPIAEIVASISARRRNGSIPTFGIVVPGSCRHDYFLLTDQSTKIQRDFDAKIRWPNDRRFWLFT